MCGVFLSRLRFEAQHRKIAPQHRAQSFDNQVVIFALGQAGDGDAAHHARSLYMQGKRSTVRGVVRDWKAAGFEGIVL